MAFQFYCNDYFCDVVKTVVFHQNLKMQWLGFDLTQVLHCCAKTCDLFYFDTSLANVIKLDARYYEICSLSQSRAGCMLLSVARYPEYL